MRAVVLALCVLSLAASVNATVCYFRILPDAGVFDDEARMASDLFGTFLNIAHNNDARVVSFEGSNGQFNQMVLTMATKFHACQAANQKIVVNFHGSGPSKRFIKKILLKYWELNRGAAANLPPAHAAAAWVVNVLSCQPVDFASHAERTDYINECGTPANRDEYGQWLFGPAGSVANMALAAPGGAGGAPAPVPMVRYPVGMGAGWITNMLVQNVGGTHEARILIHAPFDRTDADGHQFTHDRLKTACYAGYPAAAINVDAARVVSDCALSATYHVSSNLNDRQLYPAPVIPAGSRVDVNMLTRPTLHTLVQAFPDLAGGGGGGHVRVVAAGNTPLGRKAALTTVYTKAPVAGRANVAQLAPGAALLGVSAHVHHHHAQRIAAHVRKATRAHHHHQQQQQHRRALQPRPELELDLEDEDEEEDVDA